MVNKAGEPQDTTRLMKVIDGMPKQFRAPIFGYARKFPFVLEPGKGEPVASYNSPKIVLRESFFTEPKSWATLLHEATHAILQTEGTTLQQLRTGDLLLKLLGQNPADPKFDSWKKDYSNPDPYYQFTLDNGKLLVNMLGLKLKNFDVYPFGNYYETVPGMVELYARHYTRRWPDQTKPLIKWCMQRFADIDTFTL